MKNYNDYFNLSDLEKRLFEEEYFLLIFTGNDKNVPIISHATKFTDMIQIILYKKGALNQIITEKEIIEYMDNPNTKENLKILEKIKSNKIENKIIGGNKRKSDKRAKKDSKK
jgi:hypothetical protein